MADNKNIAKYSDSYSGSASAAQYYPTNLATQYGMNGQNHPVASKVINFLGDIATVLGNTPENGNIFYGVNALNDRKRKEHFMQDYNTAVGKDIQDEQNSANFYGGFGYDRGIVGQQPKVLTPMDGVKQGDPNYQNVADTKQGYGVYNYPRNLNVDTIEKMGNILSADNSADYSNKVINSGGKTQELPSGKYSYIKQSDIADTTGKQIDAMGKYADSEGLKNSIQGGYQAGQTVFDRLPDVNVGASNNPVGAPPLSRHDENFAGGKVPLSGGVDRTDTSNLSEIPFFVDPRYSNEGFKSGYDVAKGGAIDYPKSKSEILANEADAQKNQSYARALDRTPQLDYAPPAREYPDYGFQNTLNTAKMYDDSIGQVSGQIQSLKKIYFDKNTKNKDRESLKLDIDGLTTRLSTLQANRDGLTQSMVGQLGGGVAHQAPVSNDTGSYAMKLSPAAQSYLQNRNNK